MAGIKMHLRVVRNQHLSADRLRAVLLYDAETGLFYRRRGMSKARADSDRPAGSVLRRGYVVIVVDGLKFYAHRLAWLYVHGAWPPEVIDHIDNNPSNNSIENLRSCTQSQNLGNKGLRRPQNTSGFTGVTWDKRAGKWVAKTKQQGKWVHIGTFSSAQDASKAYEGVASEYWGEFRSD